MSIRTFFKLLTLPSMRRQTTRRPMARPCLEALEERLTPSFALADYDVGVFSNGALAADFNNDLVPDLASKNGSTVSVLVGNGDGTFGAARSFSTGAGLADYTGMIAVGDFNGDEILDLAAAIDYAPGNFGFPTVLLGNGDGTFQTPRQVSVEIPPALPGTRLYQFSTTRVAVADANGDGRSDLLFTGEVWYLTDNGEEFYYYGYTAASLSRGDGTFAAAFGVREGPFLQSPSAEYASDFVAADLNADGRADMVGPNGARYGQGDGTFGAWQDFSGPQGVHVAVADFNRDGKLDIAATNAGPNPSGGFIRLGNGDGSVQPAQSYASGADPGRLLTADFNGDGKADLVTANGGDPSTFPNVAPSVTVCLGNGNGTFQAPLSFQTSPSGDRVPSSLAVADFNGDGLADAAVFAAVFTPYDYNLRVLLNDGIWTSIRISDVSVSEGNAGTRNATFTVTLAAAGQTVTVAYVTADGTASAGSDYQGASGTLIFAPGETSKTITILVNSDRVPEPNETFFVNLSNPANATIADGQGVGTILDDEPRISISDATKKEGNGKKTTLITFTVTLSAAYDQAVTMSYRTMDGTATTSDGDYIVGTGTLTFAPGETMKTITIAVKSDSKKESNETFALELFGASSNALLLDPFGIGTILNDD